MRANRCHLRVALAPLNVEPCDGAMRRGEWCKTGGTHRVDGRPGRRKFGLRLARKGPMRNLPWDRCALMYQVYTRTYVSGLHAHLCIRSTRALMDNRAVPVVCGAGTEKDGREVRYGDDVGGNLPARGWAASLQ